MHLHLVLQFRDLARVLLVGLCQNLALALKSPLQLLLLSFCFSECCLCLLELCSLFCCHSLKLAMRFCHRIELLSQCCVCLLQFLPRLFQRAELLPCFMQLLLCKHTCLPRFFPLAFQGLQALQILLAQGTQLVDGCLQLVLARFCLAHLKLQRRPFLAFSVYTRF